jgi:hypothetical protein
MSDLIKLFNELPLPDVESDVGFAAVPVSKGSAHRIGKDMNGCPTLLISIKESDSKVIIPNINLKNIKVLYGLECKIAHNQKIEDGKFTIVTFTGSDTGLYDSFLRFCEVLLDSIRKYPDRESIARTIARCVNLFKDISKPPLKDIHGLWSELLFIVLARNKVKLLESWHVNPEDRWDFNLGKIRYEIKSSSNRKRQHFFSHEQLRNVTGAEIIIVSIFAEQAGTGESIEDLVNILKNALKDRTDLIEKLYIICYRTLGNSLDSSFKIKFDSKLAKDNVKAYKLHTIPKISDENIPTQITELKYKIDLEGLKSDNSLLAEFSK